MGKGKHARIRVTQEAKEDMQVWERFLGSFNGYNLFMPEKWLSERTLNLYTDAAGSIGYGGILGAKWFCGEFDEREKSIDITTLELYPIVMATILWANNLSNLNLIIHTDNQALVYIINNQTVKNNERCLRLLRLFVLNCMKSSILIKAQHIPGKQNRWADMLSRQQVQAFLAEATHANRKPTQIPPGHSLKSLIGI